MAGVGQTWSGVAAVVIVCFCWIVSLTDAIYLNDYILDYEPLHFEHANLHAKHSRVRREVDSSLRWNFKAYGRTFKLHLEPDNSVFAPGHTLEIDGRGTAQPEDTGFFYQGHLTDVPGSKAHMSVHKGHVWGQVAVPGHTTYFIEPAQHHLKGNISRNVHTIIYPESRMNLDPYRHKKKNSGMCPTDIYSKLKLRAQPVDSGKRSRSRREADNPYLKYSAALNARQDGYAANARYRRATGDLQAAQNKTCFMQLRADALLYNHYLEKYKDAERTKEVILSMFASHMKQLSEIYQATTFVGGSFTFNGINFLLQRSTIIRSCGASGYNQRYCEDTLDVSNYLHLTSEENHNVFCLVHTFTYRDFDKGTLGLAWVAEEKSGNAGVCGRYGKISDSDKGIVERSLNTGIVTLINYNQEVPSKVSQITFAHEVGHNFGAEHDETAECAPYGTSRNDANNGNYIMYPNAIPGTMVNNRKFSSCSISKIGKVLATIGSGVRENCFQASDQAFCGNNIVEDNEECDCGYLADCSDPCCNGREEKDTDCKRKNGVQCSPSEGVCCTTETCEFRGVSYECAAETECTMSSSCLSANASCPDPTHKTNFASFCNQHAAVCEDGECVASVCKNIGWEECFKTSEDGVSEEEMCYIACLNPSNGECISSYEEAKVKENADFEGLLDTIMAARNVSSNALTLPAGASCDNYKGYCDVFSKCRKVDAEGPFKQLTDIIFDPVTFRNIRSWAVDHWWAVLLMVVGVILFMGVFVYVFRYDTPSQDPRKKRRGQQNTPARRAGAGAGAGGRRPDKRSGAYSVPIPMEERSSRPRSGSGVPHGAGAAYPGRDNMGYDHRHDGRDNFGYDDRAYHPPPPYQPPKGQQYDRIQGQRY